MSGIRPLTPDDNSEWLRMRAALWPEAPYEELAAELETFFERAGTHGVLVSPRPAGGLRGFIELSIFGKTFEDLRYTVVW